MDFEVSSSILSGANLGNSSQRRFWSFSLQIIDNTWVTLWLVTLVILPTTMLQVYKTTKHSCERKRRKPHVALLLANVTNIINHNVTQVLPSDYFVHFIVRQAKLHSPIM